MNLRRVAFTVVLATLILGIGISTVNAQAISLTVQQPRVSQTNQMINFYAGGSAEGYSIRVSPQGGTLTINGYGALNMMPWKYVTAQWKIGKVFIIFLVNVTQTNFRIGFLYLTNSTDEAFILRWFDYKEGNVNSWTFQGVQHVYNKTVSTASVSLPTLKIPPSTAVTNDISVLGSQLYLSSNSGRLLNGTRSAKIYPLLNQYAGGSSDYNEVWSLLADEFGNYYFAVLYMKNGDSSHVTIEHILRLNDYRRFDGKTFDAKWTKGDFQNQVTVRTHMPNLTVKVNGFPFQTNMNGIFSTTVPNGIVSLEAPNMIQESSTSRLKFSGWSNYGNSSMLNVLVNSTFDISAKYVHEHFLTVTSSYGAAQGTGWYPQGANVTFAVQDKVNHENHTRRIFKQWTGDSDSTRSRAWTILNGPKQIQASWDTQYEITITTVGLPTNASTVALIGSSPVTLNVSTPYRQWIDADQKLPITIQSTQISGSNTNYYFSELRANNQTLAGTLEVKKPVAITLIYTQTPKLSTAISLQVSPSVTTSGIPLSITGSIRGLTGEPANVQILYNSPNNSWQNLASIPVTQNGGFTYSWQASTPGEYSLKAYWPGDSQHSPASQTVAVKVLDPGTLTAGGSDPLTRLIQVGMATANNIPFLSPFISLTKTMITLGFVLSAFAIPGGSPILGYLIGSLFVGFTFVFPIAAVVIPIICMKTRRGPSLGWVIPLLVIWLSSLFLVVLGPVVASLQPYAAASKTLLLLSNTFLLPILTAFRLATLAK
jgi:hypothetical protein